MKKNYIVPQMTTTSVCHMAALCTGSDTTPVPTVINLGGTTSTGSGSAITEGD
ncbi:MAG: hypothetical protein IJ249_06105 [Paludibacteraceae bacterium]|nr:hypothetical protein [Paludibacteraceae bacterium]